MKWTLFGADPNDIEPIPDRLNPVNFLLDLEFYFQDYYGFLKFIILK